MYIYVYIYIYIYIYTNIYIYILYIINLYYLSNRWQRTKIKKSFSSWTELIQGVPQGPVFGPLLFSIYLNDLFYLAVSTEACNFADDTTFFAAIKI